MSRCGAGSWRRGGLGLGYVCLALMFDIMMFIEYYSFRRGRQIRMFEPLVFQSFDCGWKLAAGPAWAKVAASWFKSNEKAAGKSKLIKNRQSRCKFYEY